MAKVLLVEDDNNLREIYEARLQAEGYETATASDGEQALVVAKEAKPDLVISDVMMPKISGFEMLDILRNTDGLKDVKVIMLTALGQSEDKTRADQLGADKYLVKSQVTLEDIVKTAHQLLDDAPAAAAAPATPAAAPTATAIPADDATPAATTTDTPADAVSTADEAQAMQAQIDSFAAQPAVDPPAVEPEAQAAPATEVATPEPTSEPIATPEVAAPVVAEPAVATEPATPAPVPPVAEPANDAAAAAHDDQVMAAAVDSLSGTSDAQKPSDVTAVEVAPPAPNAPAALTPDPTPAASDDEAEDDGVTVGHKKIIKPLSDPADSKPDINKLLADQVAADTANDPVPTVPAASEVAPNPVDVTEPPVDPNKPNPNEIAL